jgi:hypothetical protein
MLTGGFRTRAGAEYALSQNACDLIGIGRPAAVDPGFAKLLLDDSLSEDEAQLVLNRVAVPFWAKWIPLTAVGAGWETVCCLILFFLSPFCFFLSGLGTMWLMLFFIVILYEADPADREGVEAIFAGLIVSN